MRAPAGEFTPWLGLFETLRVIVGIPLFCEEHRLALEEGAVALGLEVDFDLIAEHRAQLPPESGRWRWLVGPEGTETHFRAEALPPAEPGELSISPVRVGSQNWDARYKTLSYLSQTQARRQAATPQVALLNENGHLATVAGGNLFWRQGDTIYTPAIEAGCRRGVVRSLVLFSYGVEEGLFPPTALERADEIFWTNSLRGIVSIGRYRDRPLEDFTLAEALRSDYTERVGQEVRAAQSK